MTPGTPSSGPVARVPGLPLLGQLADFRRDRLALLHRLAHDHGDVVAFRLGPQQVVLLSHPDAIHELLVEAAPDTIKGPILRRARVLLGDGLLTSEGELHRRQRRLVQPAFTRPAVAAAAPAMVAAATVVRDRWVPGDVVDLHDAALSVTVTAAGAALLSTDISGDTAAMAAAVDDVLAAYDLLFVPGASVLQRLPLPAVRRLRRGADWLDAYVRARIGDRSREALGPRTGRDVLDRLLGGDMSDDLVRDEVLTLLLAGHETTASALTWALHLSADDSVDAAVHAELSAVLHGRPPTAADAGRLPITRGLLAEALRLHPPSWAMARELTGARTLAGAAWPAGTVLLASQHVVHSDPRWWVDPERADPMRWVDGPAPRRGAFFPFGDGPRRCIGEAFAWTEGILALAVILQRWRVTSAPGADPVDDPKLTLRPVGARAVVHRR